MEIVNNVKYRFEQLGWGVLCTAAAAATGLTTYDVFRTGHCQQTSLGIPACDGGVYPTGLFCVGFPLGTYACAMKAKECFLRALLGRA